MAKAPLYWIKQIQNALIEAKTIPLFGHSPAFPWEELSQKIGAHLQSSEVTVNPRKTQFMPTEEAISGFGAGYIAIALELTPLDGQAFWVMGKEDMAKLTTLALLTSSGNKGFSSPKFQEGFYYFLATQVLAVVDELKAFGDLSLKLGKFSGLPHEEALCIDVEIQHPKATMWGRLVCPASFHQAFKSHFNVPQPPPLTSAVAKQTNVVLRLDVGHTTLPLSKWKGISIGDFIVLDRCTFDPKSQKGTLTIVLEQIPLFRARIKDNNLKIVDYALYQEEQNQMSDEENSQDFEEENLPPEAEPETESEETSLWSSQDATDQMEKMISTQEIPLVLTVEVAKLRMNLDKLLELAPGNVIELPVRPEQGVDITIGGKKIAKAELIKLGEMIGIKILQLGE